MADDTQTTPTTQTPAPAPQETTKASAAQPKHEAAKAAPEPAKGAQEPKKGHDEPKKAHVLEDADQDPPETAERLELTPAQLKRRLDRASSGERKRILAEMFGVEDPAEAKKKLERWTKLEEDEAKRKREALSEKERLEQDVAKERARADELDRRYKETQELHNYEREDQRVQKIAAQHIDPDYIDHELTAFARHLSRELSPDEVTKLKDKDIAKYFEKRVAAKPKIARDYEPPSKVPLDSGAAPNRPAPAAGQPTGAGAKPYAPGNGMSKAEVMRRSGYRY